MNPVVKWKARRVIRRSAKTILEACIRDINNGLWICGELCKIKPKTKEVLGCAIGLVGINGGVGKEYKHHYELPYPEDVPEEWPDATREAIRALSRATPANGGSRPKKDDFVGHSIRVIEYNDGVIGDSFADKPNTEGAISWFTKALKYV